MSARDKGHPRNTYTTIIVRRTYAFIIRYYYIKRYYNNVIIVLSSIRPAIINNSPVAYNARGDDGAADYRLPVIYYEYGRGRGGESSSFFFFIIFLSFRVFNTVSADRLLSATPAFVPSPLLLLHELGRWRAAFCPRRRIINKRFSLTHTSTHFNFVCLLPPFFLDMPRKEKGPKKKLKPLPFKYRNHVFSSLSHHHRTCPCYAPV